MTAPAPFAAWLAAAKARQQKLAEERVPVVRVPEAERDLATALAMLEVAHEALRAVCSGWDGGADMQPVLDQLDEIARGEP